ncbi:MAG: SH3 domain-containing protein [Clostridia bacterium]|nr:SH3 domain-containing protein [Clostridia bacterium]
MKRSMLSILIVAAMMLTVLAVPFSASASVDLSDTNLNTVQKYYLRLMGSLARADYYQTDVLASVTVSQAIYEGGWGRYSLPVGGNNIFGIKAYSSWQGMVYDQRTSTLYGSYEDFVLSVGQSHVNTISAWRAHKNWAESVSVHSNLFIQETKYAKVIGEKDYAVAAREIVNAGYCDDDGYADTVIKLIEQYGLTAYDDLTPDDDGIVAVTTDPERKFLEIGETYSVPLTYYPADAVASAVSWASDNEAVATVDENGTVTAVSHGMTLITATLANGREACLIVYVDCNATVIDKDAEIFVTPSTDADSPGKIYRGTAMKVTDETVYSSSDGSKFYKVEGFSSKDNYISGYALAEYIYIAKRYIKDITIVKDNVTIKPGDTYTVKTAISPADAIDTVLNWSSSDEAVATVDENGVITAVDFGETVVTVSALGGTKREIAVTVAPFYKEYKGICTSYETLIVRSEPRADASRVGTIDFLTEITVVGEPDGIWYKVSGKSTKGTTISGYSNSSYIRLASENYEVTYATAGDSIRIYKECDTGSMTYGVLASGTKYAIIGDGEGNWDYVVGLKNPDDLKAIHGYADLTAAPIIPELPVAPTDGYYGITQSDLNVRSGAGTGFDSVGKFANQTKIVIIGEAVDGWYRVYGIGTDGKEISGYSSASYITLLYYGKVDATTLNVRSEPNTSGTVVGQFKNGDEVILIGEAVDGWYKVESKDGTVKGYCSGDYIVKGNLVGTKVELPKEEEFSILDESLTIDSGVLNGVALKTAVKDLLPSFTGNVSIVDALGTPLAEDDFVGTGCKILVSKNGTTYTAATFLVKGDIDGDGKVSTYDYLRVKRHFMGTLKLEGVYLKAALLSGRDKVTVADYVLIKRLYYGTYKL